MKFFNLLKKELKELITVQMIATLVIMASLFVFLGDTIGGFVDDIAKSNTEITLCDQDNTDFSKSVIETMKANGSNVNLVEVNNDDRAALLKELDVEDLIIIPEGFTSTIFEERKPAELEVINTLKGVSTLSQIGTISTSAAIDIIKSSVTQAIMVSDYKLSDNDIILLDNPIVQKDVTVVDTKSSDVNSSSLISLMSMQNMLFPIIIFLIINQGSQMIVSSISTEKIDKTLETLLSTPVTRLSVVGAKMLAASIMALINAGVMMFSYNSFTSSLTGAITSEASMSTEAITGTAKAMTDLGLNLSVGGYLLIGLQMFMTLLIALSLSMILGAMVDNAKAAQTVILPVIFAAMFPYIISMIADINSLPTTVRMIISAIPFTHTYNASSNIMFNNMGAFWAGFAYQAVFLAVCMIFLLKLFTSDKIFTISLNLGQKSTFKKKSRLLSK